METKRQRAAAYLRMSTDQQQYSIANQLDAITVYAALRGIDIVATYEDEGKSGLTIEGRGGLQSLLRDVQAGSCSFRVIIVYDVSRWGRFQDADESAYYEYICKRAGIGVEYCAEQFENNGSPLSTIIKSIKRAMAGEYSRELSTKVFFGQQRLIQKGFILGGMSGYGFRRQIVDPSGVPKVVLSHGQWKNIRDDRIVLIPGPAEEIETIRWIYERYIGGADEVHIAADLKKRGPRSDNGKPFTARLVHTVLTSERYIGTNVWNKSSSKLKSRRLQNTPESWVKFPNAFPALIDTETFEAAKEERRRRHARLSDDEMLSPLRVLLQKHGKLTIDLINGTKGIPTNTAYVFRFGSMRRVYDLVGHKPSKDCSYADINQRVREPLAAACDHIATSLIATGIQVVGLAWNRVVIDKNYRLMVTLSRFRRTRNHSIGWHVPFTRLPTDIFVIARLDQSAQAILDYFVVPRRLLSVLQFNLTEPKANALHQDYWSPDAAGLAEKVEMVRNELARDVRYFLKGHERHLSVELDVFPPSRSAR